MKRFFKVFFYALLAATVAASLTGLVLWKTSGLRLYSVQTASMEPALQPGDLAVSIESARLQPGDIISYRSSSNYQQIVSHRVVKIYPGRGYVITKGDGLKQPDPAVPLSSVTGRTVKVLPKLGYLADLLKSPAGLIGLVYLPALALATYELSRLLTAVNYRSYGISGQKH